MFSIPTGFFIWVTKSKNTKNVMIDFYHCIIFLFTLFSLFLLVTFSLDLLNFSDVLFPNVLRSYVYYGLFFALTGLILTIVTNLADGIGIVSIIEKLKIFGNGLKLLALFFTLKYSNLTLISYFQISIFSQLIITFLFLIKIKSLNFPFSFNRFKERGSEFRSFLIDYIKPFISASILSFLYGQFEVWYLQYIGGNKEQASLGIATKILFMVSVFFGSFTSVLAKDYGTHIKEKNFSKLRDAFDLVKYFYIFTVFVCIGIVLNTDYILKVVGKGNFDYSKWTLVVMCFYTIHQCLGQLSGVLILASGKQKFYAMLSKVSIFAYFPMLIIAVTPESDFSLGLGLGSVGVILIKTVVQLVTVNLQLKENCRYLSIKYKNWVLIQLMPLIVFTLIGFISHFFIKFFVYKSLLYIALSAVFLYLFPIIFLMEKEKLKLLVSKLKPL